MLRRFEQMFHETGNASMTAALSPSKNYKLFNENVVDLLPLKEFQLLEISRFKVFNFSVGKQVENRFDSKKHLFVCSRDNLTVIAYLLS